jgi:hypothetical protein
MSIMLQRWDVAVSTTLSTFWKVWALFGNRYICELPLFYYLFRFGEVVIKIAMYIFKGKNQYMWHGNRNIAEACRLLHEETKTSGKQDPHNLMSARVLGPPRSAEAMAEQPAMTEQMFHQFSHSDLRPRREQSLGYLSKIFVKMFLHSESRVVSLQEAAKELVDFDTTTNLNVQSFPTPQTYGLQTKEAEATIADAKLANEAALQASKDSMVMADSAKKSKVRRLYDIANVLTALTFPVKPTSLGGSADSKSTKPQHCALIRKIHLTQTRSFAYMWEGAGVYPLKTTLASHEWTSWSRDDPSGHLLLHEPFLTAPVSACDIFYLSLLFLYLMHTKFVFS